MRKIILSLLLAGVAASPALATRPPERDREVRVDSGDRGTREESRRSDPAPRETREQPAPRTMTGDPGWSRRGGDDNPLHAGRDPRAGSQRGGVQENTDQVLQRVERRKQATQSGDRSRLENARRDPRWTGDINNPQLVGSGGSRRDPRWRGDIAHPQLVQRDGGRHRPVQWDRDWRGDHRYDWRDARRHHGSRFHLGVYFDPFGWGYRQYQIGYRLYPDYYSSRYWIGDPAMYSLPFPPPGTQWIRYYNDALLVDMYSGQVIDAIPNFFW